MSKHLVINNGSIIGEVDLSKRASLLPFACFPGFSFVDENLVDAGSLKDLRSKVRSALYVGVYYPGGVCLPVYPIRSENGLVIYQLNSPDDDGFIQAHQKQFELNSMPESLGLLGFIDFKSKAIFKSGAASLCGYNLAARTRSLGDVLVAHGFTLKDAKPKKNDEEFALWVLASFGLTLEALFSDRLVKPS